MKKKIVAEKAPVDGIQINDSNAKVKELIKLKFSYSIKVADFCLEIAEIMPNKIKKAIPIKNLNIIKLSETKYRLLIGPFNDIKSLRNFEK